jgi:hypothetical protein
MEFILTTPKSAELISSTPDSFDPTEQFRAYGRQSGVVFASYIPRSRSLILEETVHFEEKDEVLICTYKEIGMSGNWILVNRGLRATAKATDFSPSRAHKYGFDEYESGQKGKSKPYAPWSLQHHEYRTEVHFSEPWLEFFKQQKLWLG